MKQKIIELISQLKNKSEFIRELAAHFNQRQTSIKQNWIYSECIPEEHQPKVLEMLEAKIAKQNEAA